MRASANVSTDTKSLVSNAVIKREDGHILSLSSYSHSLIEFGPIGDVVKDHGQLFSAERYLDILAEFLHYRVVKSLWDRLDDGRAELLGYQLWERSGPNGKMYQVTEEGASEPVGIDGYYNIDRMLRLKGIVR